MALSQGTHAYSPIFGHQKSNTSRSNAERLDQFYTRLPFAQHYYGVFKSMFDPNDIYMFEPSAGRGAFFRLLPPGSGGVDLEPKYPGIVKADFFDIRLKADRPVAIIGNPPYGKNASLAVRFVNHAARWADVIAMILPRSFRKASIENRIDRAFHLLHEEEVPNDAFEFEGKTRSVPAVFQIWVRRSQPRDLRPVETKHPDFSFTTPNKADFAIQRVGARAGRVHHNLLASPSSHYFIKANVGGVEAIIKKLDLVTPAANTAGNPSLAKCEIVSLYRQRQRGTRPLK